MNQELTKKLVEKYAYMFREMDRSKEILAKQTELQEKCRKAKEEGNDARYNELLEEIRKVGCYHPIAFGFECDDGWYDLLDKLMDDIQKLDINKQVVVHQVKEKLGGLRFYTGGSPLRIDILGVQSLEAGESTDGKEIHELIHEAQDKSYTTCEVCGKPGRLCVNSGHWLKTVCLEHRAYKTWNNRDEEFLPCPTLHIRERVITPENKVQMITEYTFDRESDSYNYILDNKQIFKDSELREIPSPKFYEGWYVTITGDLNKFEWVVESKVFTIADGWAYILVPDQSVLGGKELVVSEKEIEAVMTTEPNGYKHVKTVERKDN